MRTHQIIRITHSDNTDKNTSRSLLNVEHVAFYRLNNEGLTIFLKGVNVPLEFPVGSTAIPLEQICSQIDEGIRALDDSLYLEMKEGSGISKRLILINKKEIKRVEYLPTDNGELKIWIEDDWHDGDITHEGCYSFYEDEVSPNVGLIYEEIRRFKGNSDV